MQRTVVFFICVSLLIFSSVSFAQEQKGIKIENGILSFPEDDTPEVDLKNLRFSFTPDSPAEIKAIQGKIYGSGVDKKGQAIYLIPLAYDSATKEIKLLYVTNNKGTQYKPTKLTSTGTFNGVEGNSIRPIGDNPEKPWAHFYTLPTDIGYNLRLLWASSGSVTNLRPVAQLSLDLKSLTVQQTNSTVPVRIAKSGISLHPSNSWIIGKWTGFEHASKNTCKFEVIEEDGKLKPFFMWVDDKNKSKKPYAIEIDFDGNLLTFLSSGKDKFVLKKATNDRMDGTISNNAKEKTVRFWREGELNASPFAGVWDGIWDFGRTARFTIERIDNTAATVRYDVGPFRDAQAGWTQYNASVVGNGELNIEFHRTSDDRDVIIKLVLAKNQKSLKVRWLTAGTTEGLADLNKIDLKAPPPGTEQNVPKEISAFLGTWEGQWGGSLGSKLVVEKIDTKKAECIYSWDDSPFFKAGSDRITAQVDEKKSTIEWGRSPKFIFRMAKDFKSIDGTREAPGDVSSITMKKK
jgi:hypothetical protein